MLRLSSNDEKLLKTIARFGCMWSKDLPKIYPSVTYGKKRASVLSKNSFIKRGRGLIWLSDKGKRHLINNNFQEYKILPSVYKRQLQIRYANMARLYLSLPDWKFISGREIKATGRNEIWRTALLLGIITDLNDEHYGVHYISSEVSRQELGMIKNDYERLAEIGIQKAVLIVESGFNYEMDYLRDNSLSSLYVIHDKDIELELLNLHALLNIEQQVLNRYNNIYNIDRGYDGTIIIQNTEYYLISLIGNDIKKESNYYYKQMLLKSRPSTKYKPIVIACLDYQKEYLKAKFEGNYLLVLDTVDYINYCKRVIAEQS